MSGVIYYFIYGLLYLFSLLPFWVLYGVSDIAGFFLYHIIGYRKEVVFDNLAIAFPEKTLEERKVIAKRFYRNFTDNFIEAVKLLSISPKELNKRFTGEYDLANTYYAGGRNLQIHLGHFFNWEFANLKFSLISLFPVLTVYKPITSKAVNRLFATIRSRFGAKLISGTKFLREFMPYSKQRFALVFVADQRAKSPNKAYWQPFFGKPAAFFTGPEKSAKLNDTVVLYAELTRVKRGHYYVRLKKITEDARSLPEGELTKKLIVLLEENIRANPDGYLWTHKRYKHTFDPSLHEIY